MEESAIIITFHIVIIKKMQLDVYSIPQKESLLAQELKKLESFGE
jgi:hypothetical protein